jgi:hypothetical protein
LLLSQTLPFEPEPLPVFCSTGWPSSVSARVGFSFSLSGEFHVQSE